MRQLRKENNVLHAWFQAEKQVIFISVSMSSEKISKEFIENFVY
jgi:hypothetical protein